MKEQLETRLRFTLEYKIKGYSPDLQQKLITKIKKMIDNEYLTLFVSSISKKNDFSIYRFYLEINGKHIENPEAFDIPNLSKSNIKYIKEERWSIIDQMISENTSFYSDPKIIIDKKTSKRISLKNHILLLEKEDHIMNVFLTLIGLYPEECLKNPDIIENLLSKFKKRF